MTAKEKDGQRDGDESYIKLIPFGFTNRYGTNKEYNKDWKMTYRVQANTCIYTGRRLSEKSRSHRF